MKVNRNVGSETGGSRTGGQTMRQAAYERIEELLNTAQLAPGEIVTQRGLVERTGATLAAVREAIPRLEAEGLLKTLPNRGLMVPSVDVRFVREAYRLRKLLEVSAVEDAIRLVPKPRIEAWIDEHETDLQADVPPGDKALSERFQHLDWDLHQTIVQSMNNGLVDNIYRVNTIKIRMAVQSRIQVTPLNIARVAGEHLSFLRPMLAGDEAAAREALGLHIEKSMQIALGETF
ncbi:MAG: GntR family transcriptional regulator [Tropicimonas sp.]|uniref:GntR family transcriptional regulator n=1 Tax=Tropicimonas sp. TaxID=2067044 RepID=UPI003A8A5ADB